MQEPTLMFIGNSRAWHLKYNAWYKQCADKLTAWVETKTVN